MAIVGTFGDIVFEVSRQRARSFDTLQHDAGMRLEIQEVIGRDPLVSICGPESETVALTITLALQLGVDPQKEYDRLYAIMRAGNASPLVLAGRPFGGSGCRWIIEKLPATHKQFGAQGRTVWMDVAMTLRKYVQQEGGR
ncbi:MAG TPA: phage tail protein [Armatimonadota bacterium]|jgi:phage protein U